MSGDDLHGYTGITGRIAALRQEKEPWGAELKDF